MSIPQNPDPTMPVPQSGPPMGGDPTMPVAPGAGDATVPVQPGYGGGTGGPGGPEAPVGPEDDGADNKKLWLIAGGVLVLGLLVGVIIALVASGGDDDKTASTSTSSSSTSTSSSTTPSSSSTSTTAATTPQGPQINQFTVSQNPVSCPGTSNVVLTWTTQNTQSVTISIDNPNGPFGTYGPSGQQQVPFACGAGPGPTQHTYYLAANGANNQKSTKQIQVTGNFPPATTTTSTTGP
jgi:cytoskeletal protein RodZ